MFFVNECKKVLYDNSEPCIRFPLLVGLSAPLATWASGTPPARGCPPTQSQCRSGPSAGGLAQQNFRLGSMGLEIRPCQIMVLFQLHPLVWLRKAEDCACPPESRQECRWSFPKTCTYMYIYVFFNECKKVLYDNSEPCIRFPLLVGLSAPLATWASGTPPARGCPPTQSQCRSGPSAGGLAQQNFRQGVPAFPEFFFQGVGRPGSQPRPICSGWPFTYTSQMASCACRQARETLCARTVRNSSASHSVRVFAFDSSDFRAPSSLSILNLTLSRSCNLIDPYAIFVCRWCIFRKPLFPGPPRFCLGHIRTQHCVCKLNDLEHGFLNPLETSDQPKSRMYARAFSGKWVQWRQNNHPTLKWVTTHLPGLAFHVRFANGILRLPPSTRNPLHTHGAQLFCVPLSQSLRFRQLRLPNLDLVWPLPLEPARSRLLLGSDPFAAQSATILDVYRAKKCCGLKKWKQHLKNNRLPSQLYVSLSAHYDGIRRSIKELRPPKNNVYKKTKTNYRHGHILRNKKIQNSGLHT